MLFGVMVWAVSGYLPKMFFRSVSTAEVILPVTSINTPYVVGTGVLQTANLKERYATSSLMVEEVYVWRGEQVEKGDVIARIDVETSLSVTNNTSPAEITAEDMASYRKLAEQYGYEEELSQYLSKMQQTESPQEALEIAEFIYAEESGKILEQNLRPGKLCSAGERIYSIDTNEGKMAKIEVSENDITKVSLGNRVILNGAGLGGENYYGVVSEISPTATTKKDLISQTTTVDVMVDLLDVDNNFRPGLTVTAQIATGDTSEMVLLPYETVSQDENNREFIYQIEQGSPVKKYVTVKNELTDHIEISPDIDLSQPVLLNAEGFDGSKRIKMEYRGEWYG